MPARSVDVGITAVPALRYRDLSAAIAWLCQSLGFERQLVVHDDDGKVRYAQLTLGNSMVMLAPVQGSAFDELMVQPDEIGGAETQVCCFFVADADAYCARAKAAGAEIVLELSDKDQRGRGFSCRDPEGHLWSFGTYDPWRHQSFAGRGARRSALPSGLLAILSLAVIASLAAGGWAFRTGQLGFVSSAGASIADETERVGELLAAERTARVTAEAAAREAHEQFVHALKRATASEQVAADLRRTLSEKGSATDIAERSRGERLAELALQQSQREAAERALEEARGQLARERSARQSAERANRRLRVRLARDREASGAAQEPSSASLFETWLPNDN